MKRVLCFILLLISSSVASAQHYNAWLRSTLQVQVNEKWSTDAEFQYRRQNGLRNCNPLRERLLHSYRHWVYYRINESFQLGISPVAYFSLYNTIKDQADYYKPPMNELRFAAAIDAQKKIKGDLSFIDRASIEYRVFDHDNNIIRLRNKLGMKYDLKRKSSFSLFYELLYNVAGTSKEHLFDHYRLGCAASYLIANKVKLELGYLHIQRLPRNATTMLEEDNFLFNIGYKLKAKS